MLLACCKLHISESRNKVALESIERAVKPFHDVKIVNKFEDDTYNRVGYTLVSKPPPKFSDPCALKDAAFAIFNSALKEIDFNKHSGSHPRLGVVDYICFHPLGSNSLEETVNIARSLASDIGTKLEVPTFLYGAAHESGRTLDSIRRELGYFRPNAPGNMWVGGPNTKNLPLRADEGPSQVDPSKGVVLIGSSKWMDNYNIPIFTTNFSAVRRIAKVISERGGGLPSVQAVVLAHGEGEIEIACNILEPSKVGGDQIQVEVERLAQEEGIFAGRGYYTDLSPELIINTFMDGLN